MIHDDQKYKEHKRCTKNMKPLWKVKGFFNRTSWKVSDVQIVRETWVLSFFSASLSLCIYMCVCLSLCVVCCCDGRGCGGGGGRRGGGRWREDGERLIEPSRPKFPSSLLKLNSFIR